MKSKKDYRYDIVLSKKYISRWTVYTDRHIILYAYIIRVVFVNPLLRFFFYIK